MSIQKELVIKYDFKIVELAYYANANSVVAHRRWVLAEDVPFGDFFANAISLIDDLATELNQNGYYSKKTVCTNSACTFFTKGKIYTWKNGRTITDHGDLFPLDSKIISLQDLSCFEEVHSLEFIEIVE